MKKLLVAVSVVILLVVAFAWLGPFYVVPILNYHSVNTAEFNNDTPKVTPEVFASQMAFIHKRRYKVITFDEFVKRRLAKENLRNCIVITFDDGYLDNYTYAFPVLREYHFPATIFIIGKHMGRGRFLNLNQIKEMAKDNIIFGSHTTDHFYLPAVEDEKVLRDEIAGSRELLAKKLGIPVDYFCYPVGGYNERVKEMVQQAGYKAAVTTNRGKGKFNQDLYALKRIKITQKTGAGFILWLKLSGYYQLFQKNKNPY